MSPINDEILVVGAGSAGAAAAALLAAQGRRVRLVDWRRPDRAGARWSNGIPGWLFDEAGFARPTPPERQRAGTTHTAVICDAEGRVAIPVPADPLIHVDMRRLVARLQRQARAAGATIHQERVVGLERSGARIRRVTLAGRRGAHVVEPRLIVDASGRNAAVRRRTPLLQDLCPPLRPDDICMAAQYQYRVTDPAGATAFLERHGAEPGDAVSYLGVAGGYSVLMVGVAEDLTEVALLCGTVPAVGVPPGATMVQRFANDQGWIGEPLVGGQGAIPLAPPCVRLTAPGVALVGDAAHMVYAIHGSGVGTGLVAARRLADAVAAADDPGDPVALHRYGSGFLRRFGGRLAAADLFRRFSQSLARSELTVLLTSGVMSDELLSTGLLQAPFGTGALDPAVLWSGLRHAPRPLLRLAPMGLRMLALQSLYDHYPRNPDARGITRFHRLEQRVANRGDRP